MFKEEGVEFLDFTRLQKKGLIKADEKKADSQMKVNSAGYIELGISVMPRSDEPKSVSGDNANAFGFLDSLAGSTEPVAASGSDGLEIQGLKNKIEDLEYKLRILEDKIAKMEGYEN